MRLPAAAGTEQEQRAPPGQLDKDPDEWSTGDERITGPRASHLRTLSREANEPFDETLTTARASKRIEELQSNGMPWTRVTADL